MKLFHAKGFTLLEVMIVVALIAILSTLAYSSYGEAVRKARRGDAQAALTGLASAMQRHYTEQTPSLFTGAAAGGGNTGAPAIFPTQSPLDGARKYYNLTINASDGSTYTLHAAPISGSAQASDKCGTLTLTSTGQRNITGAAVGVEWQDCWK
jgi:type IV pilus assembly protein PilE